ncbi:MAG: hypothetical protein IT315_11625 [Anaerolineales bacterium]|nr:hypothetical protein [Anaerolineales bacterium]
MYPFPNAVNTYFSFLRSYGFSVIEKEEVNTGAFGNGYFVFVSDAVGMEIVLDRGQVLMKIGKSVQDRQDWLEWTVVIAAYAPEVKAYDFELDIDAQVRRISNLLQLHCAKLLEGDFNDDRLLRIIEDKIGKDFRERFS